MGELDASAVPRQIRSPGARGRRIRPRIGAARATGAAQVLVLAATAIAVGVLFRGAMARGAGGEWVAPLDDSYIHFQYAKTLVRGEPFAWSPGDGYTTGATSLLWPIVLAGPYALGLRGESLLVAAFGLGVVAFVVAGWIAARALAGALGSSWAATAAAIAALSGPWSLWAILSGMETPLAVVAWTGAAAALGRWEAGTQPRVSGMALLAALPLVRPEGVAALVAIAVFGRRWPGAMRAIPFLFAPFAAYLAVNAVETGHALPAGAAAKSLVAGDLSAARATEVLWENVLRIAGSFSIQGPPLLLPLGLGCAAAALFQPRSGARGVAAFLLGATAIVLGNRFAAWHHGRYLVPLLPVAMLCAAPALARSIGQRWVRVVVAAWLLANAGMLPAALGTYADDVSDIANQQVAAGRFLARATPPDARIGVMDAGAILYLSDRRGIDLVGLGTPGFAPDFLDGTGARLAALARLPRERRPTHYAVYPSFFRGFKPVFGAELARFELERLHIAGDPLLVVYEAAPDRFAEAGRALATDAGSACDVVDFADRVSERAHATEFAALGTVAVPSGPRGARVARSARVIQSASTRLDCPGAEDTTLRVTLAATEAAEIAVEVDGRPADAARLGGGWHERVIPLQAGGARVSIVARPHVALDRVALETAR